MTENNKIKIYLIECENKEFFYYVIDKEIYEIITTSFDKIIEVINSSSKNYIIICNKNQYKELDNIIDLSTLSIIIYENLLNDLFSVYKSNFYNNFDYNFLKTKINNFENNKSKIPVLGLSYSLYGIDEDNPRYNNLSISSQDLYYIYKLSNIIFNKSNNINYCILSLCYYIFHFDLSKTVNESQRIGLIYAPLLNDYHHYIPYSILYIDQINIVESNIKNIYGNLFIIENLSNYFNTILGRFYFKNRATREQLSQYSIDIFNLGDEICDQVGKVRASFHNKLVRYIDTSKEYTSIMDNLLKSLSKKNITPIILILPTSKFYRKYLSLEYKDFFYEYISNIDKNIKFELLDLFDDDRFDIYDFVDSDHLNENGSKKATKIIDDFIDNLDK